MTDSVLTVSESVVASDSTTSYTSALSTILALPLETDTFVGRTVSASWGTASNGDSWTKQVSTATTLSVGSGKALMSSSSGTILMTLGSGNTSDMEVMVRTSSTNIATDYLGVLFRFQDSNNWYACYLRAAQFRLEQHKAGVTNLLTHPTYTFSSGVSYWIKVRTSGTRIQCRIWQDGTLEPTTWLIDMTDTAFSSGQVGIFGNATSTSAINYDSFSATKLTYDILTLSEVSALGAASTPYTVIDTALAPTDSLDATLATSFSDALTVLEINQPVVTVPVSFTTTTVSLSDLASYTLAINNNSSNRSTTSTLTVQDTFVGRNTGSGWGTSSSGDAWAKQGQTATVSASSGEGLIASGGVVYMLLGSETGNDIEVLCRMTSNNAVTDYMGVVGRYISITNLYGAYLRSNQLRLVKTINGVTTTTNTTFNFSNGVAYWVKFNVTGNILSAKAWQDGNAEPLAWMVTTTDNNLSAGQFGVYANATSSTALQFDSFYGGTFGRTAVVGELLSASDTPLYTSVLTLIESRNNMAFTVLADSPTSYYPLSDNTFQGIYQFEGQDDNAIEATQSFLVGATLGYCWAQLETSEGTYNWSLIDNDIALWTAQGKTVQLRVATSFKGSGSTSAHFQGTWQQATPQWVFDAGAASITGSSGCVYPVYWDTIYIAKYLDFIKAFGARFDNNPNVTFVLAGIGCYGETFLDTNDIGLSGWQPVGYTNDIWTQYILTICDAHKAAFVRTPVSMSINTSYLQSDSTHGYGSILAIAMQYGFWPQDDGFNAYSDYTSHVDYFAGPHVMEQKTRTSSSGDLLTDDMRVAYGLNARYALIYTQDTQRSDSGYPATFNKYAALAQPPVVSDTSGNGNSLTIYGKVSPMTRPELGDWQNTAMLFDGTSGYATIPVAPQTNTSTWTLKASMYPTILPQTNALVVMNGAEGTSQGGYGFGIAASGSSGGTGSTLVGYLPGVGWIDSGYTFPAINQWYSIVMERNGTTISFFVNGIQTTLTSTATPQNVPSRFTIGSSYHLTNGAQKFYTGRVDEVATYPTALSASRITAYSNAEQNVGDLLTSYSLPIDVLSTSDTLSAVETWSATNTTSLPDETLSVAQAILYILIEALPVDDSTSQKTLQYQQPLGSTTLTETIVYTLAFSASEALTIPESTLYAVSALFSDNATINDGSLSATISSQPQESVASVETVLYVLAFRVSELMLTPESISYTTSLVPIDTLSSTESVSSVLSYTSTDAQPALDVISDTLQWTPSADVLTSQTSNLTSVATAAVLYMVDVAQLTYSETIASVLQTAFVEQATVYDAMAQVFPLVSSDTLVCSEQGVSTLAAQPVEQVVLTESSTYVEQAAFLENVTQVEGLASTLYASLSGVSSLSEQASYTISFQRANQTTTSESSGYVQSLVPSESLVTSDAIASGIVASLTGTQTLSDSLQVTYILPVVDVVSFSADTLQSLLSTGLGTTTPLSDALLATQILTDNDLTYLASNDIGVGYTIVSVDQLTISEIYTPSTITLLIVSNTTSTLYEYVLQATLMLNYAEQSVYPGDVLLGTSLDATISTYTTVIFTFRENGGSTGIPQSLVWYEGQTYPPLLCVARTERDKAVDLTNVTSVQLVLHPPNAKSNAQDRVLTGQVTIVNKRQGVVSFFLSDADVATVASYGMTLQLTYAGRSLYESEPVSFSVVAN